MFGLEFFDSDNRHIHIPVEPLQAFFRLLCMSFLRVTMRIYSAFLYQVAL